MQDKFQNFFTKLLSAFDEVLELEEDQEEEKGSKGARKKGHNAVCV